MKLSDVKQALNQVDEVNFILPNGQMVPVHFHITEVGEVTKNFIDCGGTVRKETGVNFQLWEANDYDHRLAPKKLNDIISLSEKVLDIQDNEVEVEYQADTIGKYGLEFDGINFLLTQKQTDCLAKDNCGIPTQKPKVKLADMQKASSCCTPNSGCC